MYAAMGVLLPLCLIPVLLVPPALGQRACTGTDPCVADCAGCTAYDKVPNPDDCRGFFVCESGTSYNPTPFQCKDNEVFDVTVHDCVPGTSCDPCPSTACDYECTTNSLSVPDAYDCNVYYECTAGVPSATLTCPASDPFFDGLDCQTDETHCCHCHPYCYASDVGKLIADPKDCRKYHGCSAVGEPEFSGECNEGKGNFDVLQQTCSLDAPCVTPCVNVVDSDGCIDPFTCEAQGNFAKCPYKCVEEYYHCEGPTGEYQEDIKTCFTGTVFHPESHTCVIPSECP